MGSVTELVVSLSGLTDDLRHAPEFAAALDDRGVPLTHLLRPASAPPELVGWIRERLERGDAMALHGYDHALRPLGNPRGRRGEFAELPRHEAGLRLTAARRALTALGLRTDVFVPPAGWRPTARSRPYTSKASASWPTTSGSATCRAAPSRRPACSASALRASIGCWAPRSRGRSGAAARCGSTCAPRTSGVPAGLRRSWQPSTRRWRTASFPRATNGLLDGRPDSRRRCHGADSGPVDGVCRPFPAVTHPGDQMST